MADLSKIKLGSSVYTLKDAQARADMTTLLGGHTLEALGTAAWRAVAASISDVDGKIADAATVKAYVDEKIAAIHSFDVVVCGANAAEIPAGAIYKDGSTTITGTMVASASTMYKIYLVKNSDAGAGAYLEYISLRKGAGTTEDPYVYSWEMIGSTVVDLSNYVQKTRKIANITLENDITVAQLQTALGLENLAYASTASGSTSVDTIDSITMAESTVAGNATVTSTSANATLSTADYTPEGSLLVDAAAQAAGNKVLKGGSISVTVKDAAAATDVTDLTYDNYTPQGTIAAKSEGGTSSVLKSAAFQADATNGVAITGTVSKPDVNLTSSSQAVITGVSSAGTVPSFTDDTIGTFVAPAIGEGFVTAGTAATYSHSGFSGGSLGEATTSSFNTDAQKMHIAAGAEISGEVDAETLIVEAAGTASAVTAQGSFTAAVYGSDSFSGGTPTAIDTTKFSAGSWTAGTFNAGAMPTFSSGSVNNVTGAALAAAPTFSGDKFTVATSAETVLKDVEFTGSAAAIKLTGAKYLKQEISSASFSGTEATLAFSGTKKADAIVTAVAYDKADASAAYSTTITPTVSAFTRTAKAINVTVTPD